MKVVNGSGFSGVPSVPGYLFELPFERSIDFNAATAWWQVNWIQSIYWSVGYLLAIYVGRVSKVYSVNSKRTQRRHQR